MHYNRSFSVITGLFAIMKGVDCEKELLESFKEMKTANKHLIHKNQNSHIY